MAFTQFPAFAQFLLDGYKVRVGGGVVRHEMDDGHTQQTPTSSRSLVTIPVTYRLFSEADKDAFEHWRRVDLVNGSLFFAWPDPRSGLQPVMRRARIVKGEVEYEPLTTLMDDWTASFTMEYYD